MATILPRLVLKSWIFAGLSSSLAFAASAMSSSSENEEAGALLDAELVLSGLDSIVVNLIMVSNVNGSDYKRIRACVKCFFELCSVLSTDY